MLAHGCLLCLSFWPHFPSADTYCSRSPSLDADIMAAYCRPCFHLVPEHWCLGTSTKLCCVQTWHTSPGHIGFTAVEPSENHTQAPYLGSECEHSHFNRQIIIIYWFVHWTPDQAVRVWHLAGVNAWCFWARHFALMVPLFTYSMCVVYQQI